MVTFSTSDQDFHALKFFMLHYIRTDQPDKKRVSISLRASTDNSIVSLVASHLSIINIHNYLDCTMEDFFQSKQQEPQKCQWPLVTRIICNTKLANQPQGYDNYSAVQHRAVQMSLALRDTYIKLDNFVWSQFGLDAFYNGTYKSLSHLGYELVLLSSSVQMGPLELGLEKTKRFYDTMYRNFSKGGFMFSAFCELKANDPLVYGGPTAQALHHYDLNSAYGHAGATSYIPNGFGVGYVKESFNPGMREPLLAIDDNFDLDLLVLGPAPVTPPTEKAKQFKGERLHRKDSLRTNSFEFKAVYASLYRLMQDGVNIERAFHNFSSFGIFYIAKYPLDLVVVDKRRPTHNVAEVMNIIGEVSGKDIIVIDDLIDTGITFVKCSEALLNAGAKSITGVCTHAVFSGSAIEKINQSDAIKTVYVTDTFPTHWETSKIVTVSVAELFGEAIERTHNNASISSLFDIIR